LKQQVSKWQSIKGKLKHFEYRLSIRAKLTLILILIPLVILPFVTLSLYYNNKIYNTIEEMSKHSELVRICETISFLTLKIDTNLKNYIVLRDSSYIIEGRKDLSSLKKLAEDGEQLGYPEDFGKIDTNIERYTLFLDSLSILVLHEEKPEKRIARDLKKYKEGYDSLMVNLLMARNNFEKDSLMKEVKKFSRSFDIYRILPEKEQSPKKTRIVKTLDICKRNIDKQNSAILTNARQHIKDFSAVGEKYASQGARNIWTVLLVTLFFLIYLIIVLPERIVVPIRRLANIVHQAEKGDLKVAIKGFPNDEIGKLVYHLSKMLIKIRKVDGLKTQKIHESERKFKFLINSISEGVIILNDEFRPLTINNTALKITDSKSESIGERTLEGIESLKGIKTELEPLFDSGEKIEDFDFTGKDKIIYRVKVWSIRDVRGHPTAAILLFIPKQG